MFIINKQSQANRMDPSGSRCTSVSCTLKYRRCEYCVDHTLPYTCKREKSNRSRNLLIPRAAMIQRVITGPAGCHSRCTEHKGYSRVQLAPPSVTPRLLDDICAGVHQSWVSSAVSRSCIYRSTEGRSPQPALHPVSTAAGREQKHLAGCSDSARSRCSQP